MTHHNGIDTPGDPPYAASALIMHESGLILSVSRKHDPNDLGLPGGKLDPGENFLDACIRETFEETGLIVVRSRPVYGAPCGTEGVHVVHWNQTFLCRAEGEIRTTEKGRVVWIPLGRLITDKHGKYNSFGHYNMEMIARCTTMGPIFSSDWMTRIPLDPALVEKDPEFYHG